MPIHNTEEEARPKRRRRRTAEAARHEILDAAERILIDVGPHRLKLADVAQYSGEPHSTVLHHFGSISKLQEALIVRLMARILDEVTALALKADASGDVAVAIVKRTFSIYSQPAYARLIAWLTLSKRTDALKILDEQQLRLRDVLRDHLLSTDRPERADPANIAGLISVVVSAAVGEALSAEVLAEPLRRELPPEQNRDWIAELVVAKLGVRPVV